jgi:prophage antirepressor-like protein
MSTLTVMNTSIRLYDGLYCLNDLHKAAGGEKKSQPNNWLRIDQTKELIVEIERSSDLRNGTIKRVQGGNPTQQGTYASKELVYAYAMWISAKFHLAIIRAFDAMVTGSLPRPEQTPQPAPTQPWTFNTTQFNIVNHNGQPWLRTPEISTALGYSDPYSVHKVYHRHVEQFGDDMTAMVELETAHGQQTGRIFSLPGCMLIAKFSHTKLAKDFGRWVVDAMDRVAGKICMEGPSGNHGPQEPPQLQCSQQKLIEDLVDQRLAALNIKNERCKPIHKRGPDYARAMDRIVYLKGWAGQSLPPDVRETFTAELEEIERSLRAGWTGIDEALIHIFTGVALLKRWRTPGDRVPPAI